MSALVERIIAARDVLKARRHDFYSLEVLDAMADAANGPLAQYFCQIVAQSMEAA